MHTLDTDALDLAFKGLVIGVAASAPLGPVGVLVVQRTLNKGRWRGFATGVGAAISDLLYAIITGAGLSFVLDFVEHPHTMRTLQLTSSVLLFAFGLMTYRSRPHMHKPSGRRGSLWQNGATGFLLTLGNPLIVLLFLVLFARMGFVVPGHPVEQTVGYVFVFLGCLLWWYGLTHYVGRLGDMKRGRLLWLNRTIGIVVMVVSLLGFYFTLRGKSLY